MSLYYTQSGRDSKAPERPFTSQGVGAAASGRAGRSDSPSQPRPSGAIRNTGAEEKESDERKTADGRSFNEPWPARKFLRQERHRQESGPTSAPQDPEMSGWNTTDERELVERTHTTRAKRLEPTGDSSGPSPNAEHAGAEAEPRRSGNVDVVHVKLSSHVTESTPRPRSHASNTRRKEFSSIRNEAEGGNRNYGVKSEGDSPDTVTVSGRPVAVPPCGRDRLREYQLGRQMEASVLSNFNEPPMMLEKVEEEQPSFRKRVVCVDKKGSPTCRYGGSTPEQRPLPRALVNGTLTSDKTSQEARQATRGIAPKSQPAMGKPRPSTSWDHADSTDSGWKLAWKPAETFVRSVVDSIRGEKTQTSVRPESVAPPTPPPKDPKYRGSIRVESDDEQYFTVDTEWERQSSAYRTPPSKKAILPLFKSNLNNTHEIPGTDVSMTNHSPVRETGKRARFAMPVTQPTSLLHNAKAERERRKRRAELEAKVRVIEGEYEAMAYQLAILESEQTALEEAGKLRQDLLVDAPDKWPPMQTNSGSEEVKSASDNSVRDDSTREDDLPARPERDPTQAPPPKTTERKAKSAKGTNSSKKDSSSKGKGHRETDRKSRQPERKEEQPDSDRSPGVAMYAANSMFKEMFEDLWNEKMGQAQPAPATYSQLQWRGYGFQREPFRTPSMIDGTSTTIRGNSVRRSAKLMEDSSESSEKGTETEDEPTINKKRKGNPDERRAKERKAAVKALAIGKPTPWNGEPTYDKFDRWVDQVDEWRRNHNLSEFAVIATMGFVLEGAAKEWFKAKVRDREHEWTLEELNSALFTDMFPPNIDSILRDKFDKAEQGNNNLKDWHKHVIKSAWRVPNLSEHEIRRKFMNGAKTWLRKKWAEAGYTPEDPKLTLQTLLESGQRFERARAILIGERGRMASDSEESTPSSNWNEDQGPQTDQHMPKSQEEGDEGYQTQGQDADERQDSSSSSEESTDLNMELTAKKRARLLSEGRCFECKHPGHLERNCPKRREISRTHKHKGETPSVYNGTLLIEGIKSKAGGPIIRLNMIEPLAANGVIASARREKEEAIRAHQFQEARENVGFIGRILHVFLKRQLEGVPPDHEWQRHLPSRLHRFTVETVAEGVFNVRDTWRGWSAYLAAKKLLDTSFKVSKWVDDMKENAPIELDLRKLTPTETANESDGNEMRAAETSNGHLPNLEDFNGLSTVYDDDSDVRHGYCKEMSESSSEWSASEWEGPLGTRLRRELRLRSKFGSSVAPESSTDLDDNSESGRENLPSAKGDHPIGCAMAQASNAHAKPKIWESKSKKTSYGSLQDNSARVKNDDHTMPHPFILKANVNGRECRALLDSSDSSDFISTTLVDNPGLKREPLSQATTLQMATQGSKSSINARTTVDFAYSAISCRKAFDIIDITDYDLILGMRSLREHVETEMEMLVDATPLRNLLREKYKLVKLQKGDSDSDGLPQSDTSDLEMRVIRGGGNNRSSVPEDTINPHDSPRERSTSVAPATRQAGGKSRHLNPAKSNKRPLVGGDTDGESESQLTREYGQKNSSKEKEYKAMMERRWAEKAPHCKKKISLDEADHGGREIGLLYGCDQERIWREQEYELEIGKGKGDAAPDSHHQKASLCDLRSIQPTQQTIIRTRKPIPPSNSHNRTRSLIAKGALLSIVGRMSRDIEHSNFSPISAEAPGGKCVAFGKSPEAPEPARTSGTTATPHETKGNHIITMKTAQPPEIARSSREIASFYNPLVRTASETPVDALSALAKLRSVSIPAISVTNKQPIFNFDAHQDQDMAMGEAGEVTDSRIRAERSTNNIPGGNFMEIDTNNVAAGVEKFW